MSELKKRVITALVLVSAGAYWMFFTEEDTFAFITVIVCLVAVVELFGMLRLPSSALYVVTLAVPCLFWIWSPQTIPLMFPLLVPLVFWMMIYVLTHRQSSSAEAFSRFAYGQWMTLLIMVFAYSLITAHKMEYGVLFLSGALLGVWAADIGAYFVGRAVGKTKLCPSISPGKSVEGFIGGIVFGTLISVLFWINMLGMNGSKAFILAIILVMVSVAGDLGESALKRAVGVKDSGKILPGHGGILDRIDALLPSIPVVTMLWLVLA